MTFAAKVRKMHQSKNINFVCSAVGIFTYNIMLGYVLCEYADGTADPQTRRVSFRGWPFSRAVIADRT